MSLEFNPNNPPPQYFWATYIPDRSTGPKFKVHRTRGHVLSAIKGRVGIAYQWIAGEWQEVFRYERPYNSLPTNCYVCGNDLIRHETNFRGDPYTRNVGQWEWTNKEKSFPDMVRICYSYECRKVVK